MMKRYFVWVASRLSFWRRNTLSRTARVINTLKCQACSVSSLYYGTAMAHALTKMLTSRFSSVWDFKVLLFVSKDRSHLGHFSIWMIMYRTGNTSALQWLRFHMDWVGLSWKLFFLSAPSNEIDCWYSTPLGILLRTCWTKTEVGCFMNLSLQRVIESYM